MPKYTGTRKASSTVIALHLATDNDVLPAQQELMNVGFESYHRMFRADNGLAARELVITDVRPNRPANAQRIVAHGGDVLIWDGNQVFITDLADAQATYNFTPAT